MTDTKLAGPCGLYCGSCKHLGKKCKGCGHEIGLPFWAVTLNIEICPLYNCCVFEHKLRHCGECKELPCELFLKFRDPDLNDEEAELSLQVRRADLLLRKKVGCEKWIELKKKKIKINDK